MPHRYGPGATLFAPRLSDFPPELRHGCSKRLATLAEEWPRALEGAPKPLAWFVDTLRERRCVLEREVCDGRIYWAVRFPKPREALGKPLMLGAVDVLGAWTSEDGEDDGFDARRKAAKFVPTEEQCGALPELRWLAMTFGTLTLAAEQSGNAVFGKRVRDLYAGDGILDLVIAEQPKGYEHWLSLYEVDGDHLMFDPPNGAVRWMGGERGNVGKAKWSPRAALKHVLETMLSCKQTNAYEMSKR